MNTDAVTSVALTPISRRKKSLVHIHRSFPQKSISKQADSSAASPAGMLIAKTTSHRRHHVVANAHTTQDEVMLVNTTEQIDLLIVDSQGTEYLALSRGAEEEGMQIVHASDGHQALQFASTRPARVWVANLKLPDMTGIELLKLIKVKRATTPFYLVSDRYSPEDEIAARAAGATGYLSKPVNATWLDFCRAALARQPGASAAQPQFDGIKI